MRRFVPFACLLLPIAMAAQTPPATSTAEANAEASANSSGSKSKKSSSSQTVTRRLVVVNGKTIVDEKKVNNKPVKGGRKSGGKGLGLGGTPALDIEEMKRDMMRKLRKQLDKDVGGHTIRPPLRVGGWKLTPDAQKRDRTAAKNSGTKMSPAKKLTTPKTPRGKLVPRTRKVGKATRITR
ncbi:MAG: hypothetical protein ACI89X_001685 [Planctomycetota bacterium]|jgi:hypothetical protein